MIKGRTVLATVCARGGSKGVKGKNIRHLGGKPLICHSLDLLNQCEYLDHYAISTDSEQIIQIVSDYGFQVDYRRPAELAGDRVSRIEAIRHVVRHRENHLHQKFDIVIDLGVATPLKNSQDLNRCLELLVESSADNVLSVCPASRNPYFNMVEILENQVMKVKKLPQSITCRELAPPVYDLNDAFNAWFRQTLFSENPQYNPSTKIYIMPRERGVDIDEEMDFLVAEALYLAQHSKK